MKMSIMWLAFLIFGVCSLNFITATRHNDGDTSLESKLEEHLKAVTRRLELLESRDEKQQTEINLLRTELRVQKQRTTALENKLFRHLKAKNERIQKTDRLQTDTEIVPNDGKVKAKVNPDHQSPTGNKIVQRERRAEDDRKVAFFATLTTSIEHAGVKQNIVFDHVITNIGNAYSSSLGAFTAPVPGTYVFSVTLTAYALEEEHYVLSQNGIDVSYMYSRAHESPYMVTGHTAVLQLSTGDNVEIQTKDADSSVQGLYSTFSGFLLQEDHSSVPVVGKR